MVSCFYMLVLGGGERGLLSDNVTKVRGVEVRKQGALRRQGKVEREDPTYLQSFAFGCRKMEEPRFA